MSNSSRQTRDHNISSNRRGFMTKMAAATIMASPLMVACAGPAQRLVEHHYGMTLNLAPLKLSVGQVVTLDRVNGQGIFAGRPIVEMINEDPQQYVETRGKLWNASPVDLLRDAAMKAWNASSGRQVVVTSTSGRPKLKLDLELIGIGYGNKGAGFVNILATVTNDKREVLINNHYDATGPSADSLNASVMSIENAIEKALNALGSDIAAL